MAITVKDKTMLVDAIIATLRTKFPENVNYNDGSVLRTIIEVVMEEVDKLYWLLEQIYDNSFLETAYGEELEKLVALLGVTRIAAKKATGTVIFYRSTPAEVDHLIPAGTSVETYLNFRGTSVKFETTEDVIMLQGTTEISAKVQAVEAGEDGNVAPATIVIINNPPAGIESVKNTVEFSGGEEQESDESLKERTKKILETAGLGTVDAILYKVKTVAGVREASVVDMARGLGTVDVLVLGDTIPIPTEIRNEILKVLSDTKAAGIDVLLKEPSRVTQDITLTLIMKVPYTADDVSGLVEEAITEYVNNLVIGETLIKNQLERVILNSSDVIIDVNVSNPASNVVVTSNQVIRVGAITIN